VYRIIRISRVKHPRTNKPAYLMYYKFPTDKFPHSVLINADYMFDMYIFAFEQEMLVDTVDVTISRRLARDL